MGECCIYGDEVRKMKMDGGVIKEKRWKKRCREAKRDTKKGREMQKSEERCRGMIIGTSDHGEIDLYILGRCWWVEPAGRLFSPPWSGTYGKWKLFERQTKEGLTRPCNL